MTLIELNSASAVDEFMTKYPNVVVTFSAHWCGPCKASKPALEQLASKYANDVTKNIKIAIVYENDLADAIHQYNVRAFPTYVLYQNKREMNRVEGANIPAIQQMIDNAAGITQLVGGETLGGGGHKAMSPEEARLARLARLSGGGSGTTTPTPPPAVVPANELPSAEEEKKPKAVETTTIPTEGETTATPMDISTDEQQQPMIDPTADLNPEYVKVLTEEMGFPLIRAQKGLLHGTGNTVEGAVEWLTVHQDDDDIDEPIQSIPAAEAVAQSYKCNECGKILSNMANLELHANKTGHSDFEESTTAVKPLTEEEKTAKIAEIKELLKVKRQEREEKEQQENIDREKQRRLMGKEMLKTKEQLDIEQRKREAYLRKKEKEAFAKERQRLREQLAADKAERAAGKGKLSSKLSVEGYKPDMLQYTDPHNPDGAADHHHHGPSKKASTDAAKIPDYISKISSYKAGGDGGKCLKILKIYISNIVDHPTETKYHTINMDNNAFKTKVKPFLGAKSLLLAVGFQQEGETLVLKDNEPNIQLLTDTKAKLEAAMIAYG